MLNLRIRLTIVLKIKQNVSDLSDPLKNSIHMTNIYEESPQGKYPHSMI